MSPYIVQAEEITIESSGLIGGILNQVDSTVKETTKSLSTLVDSTVNGTHKTVEDTFSFTKDVVETVVEPTQEKPISSIVNQTVELVGDTVENVKPVVENTTNTVNTVTTEVVEIVEVLPDIPVVKGVLEEVGSLLNGTTQTVSHTVETVETVIELPAQEKKEESSQPTSTEKNAKPVTPVKEEIERETPSYVEVEYPVNDNINDQSLEITQQTEKVVIEIEEEIIIAIEENSELELDSNERQSSLDETPNNLVSEKKPSINKAFTHKKADVKKQKEQVYEESPVIPINTKPLQHNNQTFMATGTTPIFTPSMTSGGIGDYAMGIVNWVNTEFSLEGRLWIHSSETMRNQWTHAPPGKPPQQTPFLQAYKN